MTAVQALFIGAAVGAVFAVLTYRIRPRTASLLGLIALLCVFGGVIAQWRR